MSEGKIGVYMLIFDKCLPPISGEVDRISLEFRFSIKGKARPKFNGKTGVAYMPAVYVRNKDAIRWFLRDVMNQKRKVNFLSNEHHYMQRTIAYRKVRRNKSKADIEWLKQCRPIGGHCSGCSGAADLDNFVGTLMDACQGVVYPNDSAVVLSLEERVWADDWGAFYEIIKVRSPEWP